MRRSRQLKFRSALCFLFGGISIDTFECICVSPAASDLPPEAQALMEDLLEVTISKAGGKSFTLVSEFPNHLVLQGPHDVLELLSRQSQGSSNLVDLQSTAEPLETCPTDAIHGPQSQADRNQLQHAQLAALPSNSQLFSARSICNLLRCRAQLLLLNLQEHAQKLLDTVSPGNLRYGDSSVVARLALCFHFSI